MAAARAIANSSTGILSERTDFDSSSSWSFLPTATCRSNLSKGSLQLGDTSAAWEVANLSRPPQRPQKFSGFEVGSQRLSAKFQANYVRHDFPPWEEGRARKSRQTRYAMIILGGGECRARKSRQILYARIILLWSASGSACGSRITGDKSSHSGFSHRSDTPEVRATFVCEVQEPRQPTRLRQKPAPLARGWFNGRHKILSRAILRSSRTSKRSQLQRAGSLVVRQGWVQR